MAMAMAMAMATRDAPPAHLAVKIESFSLHDKCGVEKYETKEFDAGNYKWRLVIYPNGHGNENPGEYVSVYLAISSTHSLPKNWEVSAAFSFFILDQISGSYHHTAGTTRRFFGLKTEWGVQKFISKKDLTTQSKGYLIDDTCLFGAEVFVNDCKFVTRCLSLKDVEVPDKHVIKISDFSKLEDEWYSEKFTAGGYKWMVLLYPNGDSEDGGESGDSDYEDESGDSDYEDERGDSVSIYLMHVASNKRKTTPCDERVKALFTICLKNQLASHKALKKSGTDWFDASRNTLGFAPFISLAELNDAKAGFIVNDTCVLEIKISVQAVEQ